MLLSGFKEHSRIPGGLAKACGVLAHVEAKRCVGGNLEAGGTGEQKGRVDCAKRRRAEQLIDSRARPKATSFAANQGFGR